MWLAPLPEEDKVENKTTEGFRGKACSDKEENHMCCGHCVYGLSRKLDEREQGEARLKSPLPSTPGDHTAGLLFSCSSTFSPNQDKTELSCSGTPGKRNTTKTNVPAATGCL